MSQNGGKKQKPYIIIYPFSICLNFRIQGKVTFHVAKKPLISYGSIGWYVSRHIYFRESFSRMIARLEDTG